MKKTYLSPKTESINVETVLLAASTTRSISTPANNATRNSDWGNIWDE